MPPPDARHDIAPPGDPGQRERAQLLRAFESSTLTKTNFCALKGLKVEQLDATLAQARAEAAAWAVTHPQQHLRPVPRPEERGRPERRDGGPAKRGAR